MIGDIIEATSIKKGKNEFEVISDIGGPEKISIERLELIPLIKEKILSHLTWAEFFDGGSSGAYITYDLCGFSLGVGESSMEGSDYRGFHPYDRMYWDVRDRAQEMDAHLGLEHARCILKAEDGVPEEWLKYLILFPGTTLRSTRDGELHLPVLWGISGEFSLFFLPIIRQEWYLRRTRFIRWRR